MNLKYQELIDSQKLSIQCPPAECEVNATDLQAARWVLAPIDNNLNFLPNHIYNQKKGLPLRPTMKEEVKCGYCSLSFHDSIEASIVAFRSLSPAIQEKLGYTHVAKGIIASGWGLVTKKSDISKHFEVFEGNDKDWVSSFNIEAEL